jgi:putative acetyltransferase
MTAIRPEAPADRAGVFLVNQQAFGRDNEARLVDALRRSPAFVPGLSLVALAGPEASDAIVGHILFTRIAIKEGMQAHAALALAPMAVLPSHQNRGIGSALVRRGLEEARRRGERIVVVVGHPGYYPRFGFVPAFAFGIRAPFDVRREAFMTLPLEPEALRDVRGMVEYPVEFSEV